MNRCVNLLKFHFLGLNNHEMVFSSEEVFQNSFPEIDADHMRSAHQQISTFLRDSIEVSL